MKVIWPVTAFLVAAVLLAFRAVSAGPPALVAEPPAGTYVYSVSHSAHGEVGNFTNVIRQDDGAVVVESRLRIATGIFGVVLYRLKEDRREVWRDGRLVEYESRADDDGTVRVTRGRAAGENFLIDGAAGRIEAPADLRTTNAWSEKTTGATVLMGTQRGELNSVVVKFASADLLEIGSKTVPARHYVISGNMDRHIWFDRRGVLVKQSFPASSGTVSFTLRLE